ncbi:MULTISPECIES: chemotaxis protein CheB [Halomonadaceae]|uniref:protein-glutamate O-methyltransferase n=1 Tax=Vreelandella halophila TaxID=86177 RepID=A0A9X4YCW3_9GAMM|nr:MULTISPECIES: chemotaxis protein CheB [Halomonas]MYL27196.1 chemotaxis protein CheB [Halomonas utahensis]MYL74398.1 chemotaxis protein CheB [Halomonas sp. 22501_18_FS]
MTTPAQTRIVAIGASAGGLTALERFLSHTPADSGMAYIVVQHLDPTRKALLSELLQRACSLSVHEARQGMAIERNSVYVIPPNTELTIIQDVLHLERPTEKWGLRLPINVLFSSLASSRGADAIGVILSGMGSDGTLGLQAIQAVGGLTIAQEPNTAEFDSMPRSAIDAGYADIIAPPDAMPERIGAYVAPIPEPFADDDGAQPPLESIIALLYEHTGHDFSLYKVSTLHRRIERRIAIHELGSIGDYAAFLRDNSHEVDLLFQELLIGVTGFFRDPSVWEYMGNTVLPQLLENDRANGKLRAWVVGCSTGEEAYSLAMLFHEALARQGNGHRIGIQIFASDLSPEAIATARRGEYPLSISEEVSSQRLARYFTAHDTHYQIKPSIRDMVMFAQHDVVLDPPFTRLDLIVCRNLLIYFDAVLQRRLLPLFHYSLNPGGILLLGSSETVGRCSHLFTLLEPRMRAYRRLDNATTDSPDLLLKSFPPLSVLNKEPSVASSSLSSPVSDNLQTAADQVLLQVYAPSAVVLNSDADIVYISGRTGKYLEPAAGKANLNFHAMVRDGLRTPLSQALKQATQQVEPVQLHNLEVSEAGGTQLVDVTVQTFRRPEALKDMTMVIFRDIALTREGQPEAPAPTSREAHHAAEIQQYRDEIETLREDARASREELQSSNEELQSTNEELQSTNEELTTSKEEMQSMNEELQTINSELQAKLDDLALAQSDLQNLLNSVEIAILFLDQDLNVRRYTERVSSIINLRESDVGRPLSDLTSSLDYPTLHDDAAETLRTLAVSEKQIPTDDGRWFSVRIMPYRRLDNVIDGVVITLFDISDMKQLEATLRSESNS